MNAGSDTEFAVGGNEFQTLITRAEIVFTYVSGAVIFIQFVSVSRLPVMIFPFSE